MRKIRFLVDHHAFKTLNISQLAQAVRRRFILDTRHILERRAWEKAGFQVYLLGQGPRVTAFGEGFDESYG